MDNRLIKGNRKACGVTDKGALRTLAESWQESSYARRAFCGCCRLSAPQSLQVERSGVCLSEEVWRLGKRSGPAPGGFFGIKVAEGMKMEGVTEGETRDRGAWF